MIFQSTLSVRRATYVCADCGGLATISIHALREESDGNNVRQVDELQISIHALREESDCWKSCYWWCALRFQSTLSVRRATIYWFCYISIYQHFNPRSPWGERPYSKSLFSINFWFQSTLSVRRATRNSRCRSAGSVWISIHALREESDPPHVF